METADELCQTCSTVDLFSLFTGPRYFANDVEGKQRVRQDIGTLREIKENARCPLCRLVKHTLYGSIDAPLSDPLDRMGAESTRPHDGQVLCYLTPIRSDWGEELHYEDRETRECISTTVFIRFDGTAECSEDQRSSIVRGLDTTAGIQLLSPDYIDPKRPLLNGYPITNMKASLDLLAQWLQTCRIDHEDTCHDLAILDAIDQDNVISTIRVIDVGTRAIQEHPIAEIEYAALSYVWGENNSTQVRTSNSEQYAAAKPIYLPRLLPKIVEDALYVCKKLSIPFLWVDLYCIDQQNLERKMTEINGMGYIYRRAEITLIDGRDGSSQSTSQGLLPEDIASDMSRLQRMEKIGSRKYITALPPTYFRIDRSLWEDRSWTFQEGNLSKRVAFFSPFDVTFMCSAGSWCESRHSGPHGHDAAIPQLDLLSTGSVVLAGSDWLKAKRWDFEQYHSIVMGYTGRQLSFESDKLQAIKGCLSVIEHRAGLRFIQGLPSIDFHYALLWTGEEDKQRDGFASWSWAGWHSFQQRHWLYPHSEASGRLIEISPTDGILEFEKEYPRLIELGGTLINGVERPFNPNQCRQWLAPIQINAKTSSIMITSEAAHFRVVVHDSYQAENSTAENMYSFEASMILQNSSDQCIESDVQSGYRPWRPTRISIPYSTTPSSVSWLLREGLELVKIMDIEMLAGNAGGDSLPARRVFCLGIDRRQDKARRFGYVHMTGDIWDGANPTPVTVELY